MVTESSKLTVVIPTCGRPARLAECLRRIRSNVEIIVADDSRDDETRTMIDREFPGVRWMRGPGRGPASNRNHGAREATGDWLLFVDDDCLPETGWTGAMMGRIEAGGVDVIEGKTVCPDLSDDPFEERVENLAGGVLWSCNLAIRRELFERLGGFDEAFLEAGGEDMELAWRIRKAGLRVAFEPDAVVLHPVRKIGWRGLWRRTWMSRWIVLYDLRTGEGSGVRGIGALARRAGIELVRLLRETVKGWLAMRADNWKRTLFGSLYRWVMFPFVLPYLLYWEIRFRQSSNAPTMGGANHPNPDDLP